MCKLRRCAFQNGGLKSNRYESPLLVISLFIDLYAIYKPANLVGSLSPSSHQPSHDIFSKPPHWRVYITHTCIDL